MQVQHENPALLNAATAGDAAKVEQLLIDGTDPNQTDSFGRTALHLAVLQCHWQTAACLLTYGADHRIRDSDGHAALTSPYANVERLHALRQHYHRFRKREQSAKPLSAESLDFLSELEQCGIVKLPRLVDARTLIILKRNFDDFITDVDALMAQGQGDFQHYDEELHWWPDDLAYVTNNIFKYSKLLINVACNPIVLDVVNMYLGKRAHIQRGVAMRYLPIAGTGRDMFRWHHDMEERRVKLMILLTDVSKSDQCMSYVRGSNNIFHSYKMFFYNKCTPDYCRQFIGLQPLIKTIGEAGDAFLFDSNGAHRGNRFKEAQIRDAVFIEYSADKSQCWGGDIDQPTLDALNLSEQENPFLLMTRVPKKWTLPRTRKAPDWVETLQTVDVWL